MKECCIIVKTQLQYYYLYSTAIFHVNLGHLVPIGSISMSFTREHLGINGPGFFYSTTPRVGPGQSPLPPYPFTSPLLNLLLYPLVSFPFPFLIRFMYFLTFPLFHPFLFYQNTPTPFPRRMS